MRRTLPIAAVAGVLLALAGSWLVRSLALTEWRGLQQTYNQRQAAAGLRPIAPGLRELDGPLGPERCVTCHLGVVLPDAHEAPFQAHPPRGCRLPLARLGCVSCHRGHRLALTRDAAHGREPATAPGLLAPDRLEAGCAGCHRESRGGVLRYEERLVPRVRSGLRLFLARGCPSCHRIEGVYSAAEAGPRLTGVGNRRDRAFLTRQLRQPPRPMPPPDLPDEDLARLVLLLQAQTLADRGTPPPRLLDCFDEPLPAAASPAAGALWARRLGCVGCHRLGEEDGGVPDLRHVAWTTGDKDLEQTLRNPSRRFPGTLMPPLEAPAVLVDSVLRYLRLQKVPLPSTPAAVFDGVCARCHGKQRDPRRVVLVRAPPLLLPRPRVTREKFIETVARGREGTAMAAWGRALSRGFIGSIFDGLEGAP